MTDSWSSAQAKTRQRSAGMHRVVERIFLAEGTECWGRRTEAEQRRASRCFAG